MRKLENNGFSAVETLLVFVIIAIIGVTGWWVWHSKENTDKSLNNTGKSQPAAVTPNTANSTKLKPSTVKYLIIKEWGVELPLSSSISDAYYIQDTKHTDANYGNDFIGTRSLAALDSDCAADGIAYGLISRETIAIHDKNASQSPEWDRPVYRYKIGNYYYDYNSPQAACSAKSNVNKKQLADVAGFKAAISQIRAIPN